MIMIFVNTPRGILNVTTFHVCEVLHHLNSYKEIQSPLFYAPVFFLFRAIQLTSMLIIHL